MARTKLLDERAINLEVHVVMPYFLSRIPSAHPREHLGRLETIGSGALSEQTGHGLAWTISVRMPNELVPRQGAHLGLALVPRL